MPSQCKVRKWWSSDQDEWTNSLTLGSKSVTDTDKNPDCGTRIESRYRITESGPEPKGVSINWSNWESRSWTQGVSIMSSWKSLRTKILSQFQNHLLEDQFVDDLFSLHHLPDQPGSRSVCVRCVRTDPDFFSQYFKSDNR